MKIKLGKLDIDSFLTIAALALILILVGVFVYGFTGWNVLISLTTWTGLTPTYEIKGLQSYFSIVNDPIFMKSFSNNIILLGLFISGSIAIGLFLAILLDQMKRGTGFLRTYFVLPFTLSYVVTGTLWAWMYTPGEGVIDSILGALGLNFLKTGWISNPEISIYCVILTMIWQFSGYTMIIIFAGIKSIPFSQIAAGKVDGAGSFSLYRHIIIPQIRDPLFVAFAILFAFGVKTFALIWTLTGGGPGFSSYVLSLLMYRTSFASFQFAEGAAIATIMILLVLVVILPYLFVTRRRLK
jgi:glucose/mannose transport system permease protein